MMRSFYYVLQCVRVDGDAREEEWLWVLWWWGGVVIITSDKVVIWCLIMDENDDYEELYDNDILWW